MSGPAEEKEERKEESIRVGRAFIISGCNMKGMGTSADVHRDRSEWGRMHISSALEE